MKIGALPGKDLSVAGGDVATEGKGAPLKQCYRCYTRYAKH